jgi:hypothetical protein
MRNSNFDALYPSGPTLSVPCRSHLRSSPVPHVGVVGIKNYNIGVASNSIIFITCFMKIGQLVQKITYVTQRPTQND